VGDLFAQENKKDDRVQEANDQLQYQLQRRREEYRLFKRAYDMIFIVVMMVLAAYLGFDNGWSQLASILWACGWMLFGISRRLVQLNIYDPHLDKKYPLTASRPDKDRKGK
jgi:lipopolysaccharide export LptBFGC system permease protein LptF